MTIPEIKTVLYVGAGTMGCYNSLAAAISGYKVVLYDVNADTLARVPQRHQEFVAMLVGGAANVGGPLLDQVLIRMNHYGRIAVCGLLADYTAGTRTAPKEFDQVLMRRLRIEGFFSPDFMHEGPTLTRRLRDWTEAGQLVMPYDVTQGLENTLAAYAKPFTGGNIGKVVVRVA